MRRPALILVVILIGLMTVSPTWAHANLQRADPPANARLEQPPTEIRLWFTETLEPSFSHVTLHRADGSTVITPASQVDVADPTQMVLTPGDLPDGVYTLSWRALSSVDGHSTQGSFAFTIGAAALSESAPQTAVETLPADGALVRALNMLSLGLAVGSVGFWLFVWSPTATARYPALERRMRRLMWGGWLALLATALLGLGLQASLASGESLLGALTDLPLLERVIGGTHYGAVWLARMAAWLTFGAALGLAGHQRAYHWLTLGVGGVILLTTSLHSHAASLTHDTTAAIAADWLHLAAMALWIGGLVQFIGVVSALRRQSILDAALTSRLVGYFSNYVRIAVAALVVTGVYASWLHVGSLDGLLSTLYGRALLVKLILFAPLFGLGAVNLLVTQRALAAGKVEWVGRLRGLLGAEIALALGVLIAVGVLTSVAPARGVVELRNATPLAPPPQPYNDLKMVDDLHIDLTISPGWVGENSFIVALSAMNSGEPIIDASLIRLRFDNRDQNLGQSELRPELQKDGTYTAVGANLSAPGNWRIRVTVQRPGKFDAVTDFEPSITLPPPPTTPTIDTRAPLPNRNPALLAAGLALLVVGGFALGASRLRLSSGQGTMGTAALVVGMIVLGSSFVTIGQTPPAAAASPSTAYQPPPDAPIGMGFVRSVLVPYLVTADGRFLQPAEGTGWEVVPLDARVKDIYLEAATGFKFAATDKGLRVFQNGAWEQLDELPSSRLEMTHGYLFSLGDGEINRFPGALGPEPPRLLDVPLPDQPAVELVMLGNHTHVLQNGDSVFQTPDLGLGWQPLDAPQPIDIIWTDVEGNLLAATRGGVLRWNYVDRTWRDYLPLPDGQPVQMLRLYGDQLYALAGGKLYRLDIDRWARVDLPDSDGAYLVSIGAQYQGKFWALDAEQARLWSTDDNRTWAMLRVEVK